MGPLGWPETIFIGLLALMLFGPKKLPELGRTVGRAINEFRRASSELKGTFDREMRNMEREAEGVKELAESHFNDSYNYDYSSYDTGAPYSPEHSSNEQASMAQLPAPEVTSGASADQGAESTAPQPHLSVTPAAGIIASGSFNGHNSPDVSPSAPAETAQETLKS